MMDQNLQSAPIVPPVVPVQNVQMEKAKSYAQTLFAKVYSNKIIFWSIAGLFGLLFLITIIGLIFGKKSTTPKSPFPVTKSTPFILKTKNTGTGSGILGTSEQKLKQLHDQLNDLDVKEERLSPPILNFDVKF